MTRMNIRNVVAALLVCGMVALPGCANTDPPAGEDAAGREDTGPPADLSLDDLKNVHIEPKDAVFKIKGDKAVQATYKAIGVFKDGSKQDITSQTQFKVLSYRVGVFKDNVFYASLAWGGKTTVEATTHSGLKASTSITVLLTADFVEGSAPSTAAADFGAAKSGGTTPTLAYPPDGVMVPPNLTELEVQWVPGTGHDLFEVSFQNEGTDIRVYTKCTKIGTAGCGYTPSQKVWDVVVKALKGGPAAKVTVRGLETASSTVGSSSSAEMTVAEEDIKGGLYYWNATPGTIVRYDFGTPNQKAKHFYTKAHAKALFCVGCHAMSLNGKRMAVALDMPAPAPLKVVDVATRTNIASGAANFMAFSPDGEMIITSDGNSMVLREAATYKALAPTPLRAKGTMPDWSADGTRVVYAEPSFTLPIPVGTPGVSKASIKLLAYDKTAKTWKNTALTLVASSGENNYYPTFSPDSQWVVYNRASGQSYDAPDAALWMVKADLSGKPLELKLANQGSNLCNSWPKFSPFIHNYQGGKLMWLTFSSRRDYGLRLKGTSQAQIWMAAIRVNKSEVTTDPSYPAFWLPFQDIKTGNHIAQWTQQVVRKKCGIDGDCPTGQECKNGYCEPK